ncbi:PE-PPE domain-containing protein [Mycobacterium sp. WMMD1722]|uniref:PE-PPE domain-containing protein n=1 Tax=Mycobacterium sp. WMMD1722 TaxID=3404117 RepID=UPI003BF5B786
MTRRQLGLAVAAAGALLLAPNAAAPAAWAATAYTIEPLGGTDTTPALFNGAVCAAYECVKVPTEATVDFSHSAGILGEDGPIARGALTLDGLLRGDGDDKLVFGFSQGAQIAGFWLRNYAPDTTVGRDTTSFLLVGDPENTYGVPWAPRVPTNTGFPVTEVWAQYDGWADWPSRFDLLAVANAVYGMLFVHPTVYDDLDLAAAEADGEVVQWENDGITYKMVADREVPILDPLRNIGLGRLADALNDDLRDHIEAQYDRPSTQAEADAVFGTRDTGAPPAESEARREFVPVSRGSVDGADDGADDNATAERAASAAARSSGADRDGGDEARTARRTPAASTAPAAPTGVERARPDAGGDAGASTPSGVA